MWILWLIFRYVVDEYCTVRRGFVARSFLDALTIGGPHGTPRPIELHAHDPARKHKRDSTASNH